MPRSILRSVVPSASRHRLAKGFQIGARTGRPHQAPQLFLVVDRLDFFDEVSRKIAKSSFQERDDVPLSCLTSRRAGLLPNDFVKKWHFKHDVFASQNRNTARLNSAVLAQRFAAPLVRGSLAAVSTRQRPFYAKSECCNNIGNPPESLPRPLGAPGLSGWTDAIRGGPAPMCDFVDLSGGFTEWYLLGNLASLFPKQTLEYDPLAG